MKRNRSPRGGWLIAATLLCLGPLSSATAAEEFVASTIHTSSTDIGSYAGILHDGTNWTMIPRGSILHLPKKLRAHLGNRPVGNLVSWQEFLRINREWLDAEEVTLRQAEGTKPIDARRLEYLVKQERIVVAVYEGGPIAVADAR